MNPGQILSKIDIAINPSSDVAFGRRQIPDRESQMVQEE
jgi:hypothetical protein